MDADRNTLPWLIERLDEVEAACADPASAAPAAPGEADETAALIARLRRLGAPAPSPEFGLRVRYAVRRRIELRTALEQRRLAVRARWREALRVASVAAAVLAATLIGQAVWAWWTAREPIDVQALPLPKVAAERVMPEGADVYVDAQDAPPAEESSFFEKVDAATADAGADMVLAWLGARNALDVLRAEFRGRFSREGRETMLAMTGVGPAREERIQELASRVADGVRASLASERLDPRAVALGLRALLAAGSSRAVGRHAQIVRDASDRLVEELDAGLPDETAVSVLAAVTDVAVVSSGRAGQIVRAHAERLVRATVDFDGVRRPVLLHRQTRLASLADAGYVLRIAPAFGAPAALCVRARRLVLAHLEERLDVAAERPEVVAAMLYGFGDLVDHAKLDARLLLWGARHLLPDYLALFHYAWGHYPVRRGWASFQNDLRFLTTVRAPEALEDAAALLLTLATNFAAPGSHELIARR